MKTLGILGDLPSASTGFAVVLRNLANELSRWFRVIYFGRFGQEKEFAFEPTLLPGEHFEYVPCQGGVWDRELVVRVLSHYDLDFVFSEDDYFSASGLVGACNFWKKPFHFLTPIDSRPISGYAFVEIFSGCDKIYIPNSSWEAFDGRKRVGSVGANTKKRVGPHLKSVYLPHGCDCTIFRPKKVQRTKKFTFVWIGRVEERKNPGAFVLAAEKVCNKMDADFFMRSDWNTPPAQRLLQYIQRKNLPFILDQMEDIPHTGMVDVYNKGDIFICTSKAGGFEMSINEAAACGLPSLATDWTYMNENIVPTKSGLLIPTSGYCHPPKNHPEVAKDRIWGDISVDRLAERMYWSYLNQEMVKAMGRWAILNIRENYQWKRVAEKLKDEILE